MSPLQNVKKSYYIPPELDFCSNSFDAAASLKSNNIIMPYPKSKTYNNLAEYYSHTFSKKKNENDSNQSILKSAKNEHFVLKRNYDWYFATLGLNKRRSYKFSRKKRNNCGKYGTNRTLFKEVSPEMFEPIRSEKIVVKGFNGSLKQYIFRSGEIKLARRNQFNKEILKSNESSSSEDENSNICNQRVIKSNTISKKVSTSHTGLTKSAVSLNQNVGAIDVHGYQKGRNDEVYTLYSLRQKMRTLQQLHSSECRGIDKSSDEIKMVKNGATILPTTQTDGSLEKKVNNINFKDKQQADESSIGLLSSNEDFASSACEEELHLKTRRHSENIKGNAIQPIISNNVLEKNEAKVVSTTQPDSSLTEKVNNINFEGKQQADKSDVHLLSSNEDFASNSKYKGEPHFKTKRNSENIKRNAIQPIISNVLEKNGAKIASTTQPDSSLMEKVKNVNFEDKQQADESNIHLLSSNEDFASYSTCKEELDLKTKRHSKNIKGNAIQPRISNKVLNKSGSKIVSTVQPDGSCIEMINNINFEDKQQADECNIGLLSSNADFVSNSRYEGEPHFKTQRNGDNIKRDAMQPIISNKVLEENGAKIIFTVQPDSSNIEKINSIHFGEKQEAGESNIGLLSSHAHFASNSKYEREPYLKTKRNSEIKENAIKPIISDDNVLDKTVLNASYNVESSDVIYINNRNKDIHVSSKKINMCKSQTGEANSSPSSDIKNKNNPQENLCTSVSTEKCSSLKNESGKVEDNFKNISTFDKKNKIDQITRKPEGLYLSSLSTKTDSETVQGVENSTLAVQENNDKYSKEKALLDLARKARDKIRAERVKKPAKQASKINANSESVHNTNCSHSLNNKTANSLENNIHLIKSDKINYGSHPKSPKSFDAVDYNFNIMNTDNYTIIPVLPEVKGSSCKSLTAHEVVDKINLCRENNAAMHHVSALIKDTKELNFKNESGISFKSSNVKKLIGDLKILPDVNLGKEDTVKQSKCTSDTPILVSIDLKLINVSSMQQKKVAVNSVLKEHNAIETSNKKQSIKIPDGNALKGYKIPKKRQCSENNEHRKSRKFT